MGTTYTRQSSFSDGDTITAALFNNEYNQLLTALSYASSGTTGHQHDGTAAEGGNVHTIGDQDFLNKIVADSTNNRWGVFVEVSSAAVEQIRISDGVISPVTDNDIDLGTSSLEFKDLFIDGTAHIDTLDVDVNATVAGTLGVTGALTGSSTIQGTTITATTAFVPDASDGAALGTSALEFSDLFLADGAVINFGADQDVSLTHVADTGILLSSTDQLQFGDSGTYIYQSADGVLDLVSDTEIELTATTIDINGAVAMDGAITGGTNITISGELDAATLDISGNADIDGTTNLDAVDIDGAVQIDATVTVGVDDTGYDVKFFGDTASAYMLWDTSADDLILGGAARVVVPASGLVIGSTAVTSTAAELNILDGVTSTAAELNILDGVTSTAAELNILDGVTSTAAELNIIDGDTSASSTTLADADRVIVNDAGTMKQVALTDFETYFESAIDTFSTIDINGGSIDGATLGTNSAITQAVIDDIDLNGKVITMTGSASDTVVFTAGTNGTLSIVTTDAAAAAANVQITADGTVDIDSAGVLTLDSGAAINIEPAAGSAILLDGTISIDAGVVTGATSITSTAFVGALTGNASGTAATVTTAAQSSITSLGTLTTLTVDNVIINGTNIGHTSDTDSIAIASDGVVTFSQIPVFPADTIDSSYYVDGSIDLAHMSVESIDSDQYVDGSIDTAHMADNQITLAKMAGLARGKIIYGDSSGDPAALTVGSANYVLTSDGTDIAWASVVSADPASADGDTLGTTSLEWSDLYLADGSTIYFGNDQDVLLTHTADSGLAMSVTGNNVAQFTVSQDKDNASTGPVLNLTRYSASPADGDGGGIIQFYMENDNNQTWTAAQIYSVATDVTDGTEDGKLIINTMKAGTATTALTISDTGIQVPDDGTIGSVSDPDALAIRSDGNIGIGYAAQDTKQVYVYDNTTTDQLLVLYQANAGNGQAAIYVTHEGTGNGIYGQVNLGGGSAVYGFHNNSSLAGIGTRGHSVGGYGGYFQTGKTTSAGLIGYSQNASHYGLLGHSNTYGVYGTSLYTPGSLTKGSGTFRIPHGLREDYDLCHSFIEGPQCDLIYRGRATLVDGQATISMDTKYGMTAGTFEWLTKADDVQTFTSNETGWDAVKSSFSGDTITIECQNPVSTDTISWMVIAERGDPNIKASTITDDDGNLIIERPSDPPVSPPLPLPLPED